MTIQTIPILRSEGDGSFFFKVALDGEDFLIWFHWNERDGHWFVDVTKIDGTAVRSGMKLVSNWPILRTCMVRGRPLGELMGIDSSPVPQDAGLEDLGARISLMYWEQADVQAWAQGA